LSIARKNYDAIAQALGRTYRGVDHKPEITLAMSAIADALQTLNGSFERSRFVDRFQHEAGLAGRRLKVLHE